MSATDPNGLRAQLAPVSALARCFPSDAAMCSHAKVHPNGEIAAAQHAIQHVFIFNRCVSRTLQLRRLNHHPLPQTAMQYHSFLPGLTMPVGHAAPGAGSATVLEEMTDREVEQARNRLWTLGGSFFESKAP